MYRGCFFWNPVFPEPGQLSPGRERRGGGHDSGENCIKSTVINAGGLERTVSTDFIAGFSCGSS